MAYTANKLASRLKAVTHIDNVADATVARYAPTTFFDMRDFNSLLVLCALVSGTGVLTFKIFGATSAAGAGATVIATHSAPTDADAAGDTLVLEITAEQLRALGDAYRYVAVEIDNDHADDINAITYIFGGGRFNADGLTADVISA